MLFVAFETPGENAPELLELIWLIVPDLASERESLLLK
jgi:hypothetical protein